MNVFTVTGNIGKDCEVKSFGGSSVCNFTVAAKSGFGDKAQTIWLDCALWGKQAESGLVQYLIKGQQVAVSGELGSREHNGKTYLTLRINNISLVGGKSEGATAAPAKLSQPAQQQSAQKEPDFDFDDDIPFS
jgi:single-strand DNA-binding protein